MTRPPILAVDFGATKIEAALVNGNGGLSGHKRILTRSERGQNEVLKSLVDLIASYQKDKPQDVAIAFAGQVDSKTGRVYSGPNLGWKDVDLAKIIQDKIGVKAFILNDVRAALYGEWIYGAGKGLQDFILIFFGTGIGGGIVSNGQVIKGASDAAGEIGHLFLNSTPSQIFESIAGGKGIETKAEEILKRKISAKEVIEKYRSGDQDCQKIIEEAKCAIFNTLISLTNLLNPSHILFGGGLLEGLPEIIAESQNELSAKALIPANQVICEKTKLGNDAPLLGAAYAFTQQG